MTPQTNPSLSKVEQLEFVDKTNNHNVVLCKGKPESIEDDVQYYFFKCDCCDSECISQPQFYDDTHLMCTKCATKIGFNGVYHNNSNEKLLKIYEGCTCSACSYRRRLEIAI